MATRTEIAALTQAHRAAQNRRAAQIAALVFAYWRTRVAVDDPRSIEAWLEIMVPRIIAEHERSARLGEEFYTRARRLEMPGAPAFTPVRQDPPTAEQIRTSLMVTGPVAARKKLTAWDKMSQTQLREDLGREDIDRKMLEKAVMAEVKEQLTGSVVRHVANGGRGAVVESANEDRVALGWVRVTKDDPCYFCAMLASRGLVFEEDSFDQSDARFHGPGDVKVHDNCGCSIKAVYTRYGDPFLDKAREFEELWHEYSSGSSAEAIRTFRQGYEGRAKVA